MDQLLGSSSRDVLPVPIRGGYNLTTTERAATDHSARIPGWGSDLHAAQRPGVPRDKAPEIGGEMLYPPIVQQEPMVKIHKSTEHARLTPVFGTSCPPYGLSGLLRDFAYHFSEGRLIRWLTLMLADRVNVVEGVVVDLAHGHVPNIPREMGIRSELKHNGPKFVRKTMVVAGCAAVLMVAWNLRQRRGVYR